jgi:hypothetical protein
MSTRRRERTSAAQPDASSSIPQRNGYPTETTGRVPYEYESPVIPDFQSPGSARKPANLTSTPGRTSATTSRRESVKSSMPADPYAQASPSQPAAILSRSGTLKKARPPPAEYNYAAPSKSRNPAQQAPAPTKTSTNGPAAGAEPPTPILTKPVPAYDPPAPLGKPPKQSSADPSVRRTSGSQSKRGSLSQRSPLQKLEVTLDGISKEEKRARVAQAEAIVQERMSGGRPRERTSGRASLPATGYPSGQRIPQTYAPQSQHRPSRSVSGPEALPPPPLGDNRTAYKPPTSIPTSLQAGERRTSGRQYPSPPQNPTGPSYAPPTSVRNQERGLREGYHPEPVPTQVRAQPKDDPIQRKAAAAGAMALGAAAYEADRAAAKHSEMYRTGSRKLQKQPSPRDRQSVSGASNGNSPSVAPPAPLTTSTPPILKKPGISQDPSLARRPTQSSRASKQPGSAFSHDPGFRLPHVFNGQSHEERRYVSGPAVSDSKSVPTATLLAEDLDLTAFAEPKNEDTRAWWEKSESEQRRSNDGAGQPSSTHRHPATIYDGNVDQASGQTYFQPGLYLKCGPLLRFRGIRRETIRSARSATAKTRDVWKGSVMIVTVDSKSDYTTPPTLRLFKQPIHLLPPPPTEINEATGQKLDPEYDDPIAGQVKLSRVGKTLYVRPVEALPEKRDLSRVENDKGLFEERRTAPVPDASPGGGPPRRLPDGERLGKVKEISGARLFSERGVTFWKFNLEVELGSNQTRLGYRINRGPAVGFWVPARGETMNMMFHSCNGFSMSVESNEFSGPDPLWRDVLNAHQTRPFHVMIGGGDQIYNDAATRDTVLFKQWAETKNPIHKRHAEFTAEMQYELEEFYLNRYSMWFSQGMFGMANSQIPMVNIWDDHDIIDGFGSYSDHTMRCDVFKGVGSVAFKYYMLFQHQSLPVETEAEESSWLLGSQPGPYINQVSRSLYMNMGRNVAFLGLDCRTERQRDEIMSEDTWDRIFTRCERDITKGETKHLIVLLGVVSKSFLVVPDSILTVIAHCLPPTQLPGEHSDFARNGSAQIPRKSYWGAWWVCKQVRRRSRDSRRSRRPLDRKASQR